MSALSTYENAEMTGIIRSANSLWRWPGDQNYLDFRSALNNDVTLANYILTLIEDACQDTRGPPGTGLCTRSVTAARVRSLRSCVILTSAIPCPDQTNAEPNPDLTNTGH